MPIEKMKNFQFILSVQNVKNSVAAFGTTVEAAYLTYMPWFMEHKFYIELNMKTLDGFERFGCFELGSDRAFALRLFASLQGRPAKDDSEVLHMDLVEKRDGLPMNMQVVSCTVEDLGRNLKIVTRELFKKINLDDTML